MKCRLFSQTRAVIFPETHITPGMGPSSQWFLSEALAQGVQTEWISWSKQASMWKSIWIEKENRICVHAPITHQENSFQAIPRDDLHPQRTLSLHIFSHFKNRLLKKWKLFLEWTAASCGLWMKDTVTWRFTRCFLNGHVTVHSVAPTFLGTPVSPQGQTHRWRWGGAVLLALAKSRNRDQKESSKWN